MNNRIEALLVEVIDVIAQKFGKRAILRGGMVLRILGCERMTNDADYFFVPYASKKDFAPELLSTLSAMRDVTVSYSFHSKCLRVTLTRKGVSIQIEAGAIKKATVQVVSNRELALRHGLEPRLITIADYGDALANKMAAWNERRLIRDLYDIWFYLKLNVRPNTALLEERLLKPVYSKRLKKSAYFNGKTVQDFYLFLQQEASLLTDEQISEELSDYLPTVDIIGLAMKIKTELARL